MSRVISLKKNEDFKNILSGRKVNNRYITIFFKKLPLNDNKSFICSISAKKKLGNAVFRNKIKRRLKSIVTEANKKFNLNYNYSYLFMAKKNVFHEDYKLIKEKIINDLKEIR